MDGFEITYANVNNVTNDLQQETKTVADAIEKLRMDMAVVSADNQGDTALNYDEAINRWQAHVDDMRLLLAKAQQALQQVAQNYQETDLREGALWDALK